MTDRYIPLNKPFLGPEETSAAVEALERGRLGGNGSICKELEAHLQGLFSVRHVLLATSCTHAMEMSLMALGIEPGDEVIMPSFTFVTTATAVVRQGARPVFAEVDERSFNLDPDSVASCLSEKTKAIMPVHYAGQGCDMQAILSLAEKHGLHVVEDAAHGVGAKYDGRYLGTIGDAGCYSFHITKNVTCGEGGAVLTNDDALAQRCEIVREKGTNRSQFLRGEVDKYTWVDIGSSYVLSDLLAAVLLVQIKRLDEIIQRRRIIWERYQEGLEELERRGHVILPSLDPKAESSWHVYALRTARETSDRVLDVLRKRGIGAAFHFVPLHISPYAQEHLGYRPGDLPLTEQIGRSLVRLPIYPSLASGEQEFVIQALYDAFDEE